jgi:quercetin dioxygenase-like cupin family protein
LIVRDEDNFVVHVADVAPAPVKPEQGWRKMDIRFILTRENSGHDSVCVFRTLFEPGAAHEIHTHDTDEFLFVVSGHCMVGAGDKENEAGPGTLQFIPSGKKHWLRNTDPFESVELIGGYTNVGSFEEAGYGFIAHLND